MADRAFGTSTIAVLNKTDSPVEVDIEKGKWGWIVGRKACETVPSQGIEYWGRESGIWAVKIAGKVYSLMKGDTDCHVIIKENGEVVGLRCTIV